MATFLNPGESLDLPDRQIDLTVDRVDPVRAGQMVSFEFSTGHQTPVIVPATGWTGTHKGGGTLRNTSSPSIRIQVIFR